MGVGHSLIKLGTWSPNRQCLEMKLGERNRDFMNETIIDERKGRQRTNDSGLINCSLSLLGAIWNSDDSG